MLRLPLSAIIAQMKQTFAVNNLMRSMASPADYVPQSTATARVTTATTTARVTTTTATTTTRLHFIIFAI